MNESKVMQFIEKFDELYAKNKGVIFQSFQEGGFTLSEQKEIFDGLKTKQKCQLYNTISLDVGLLNIINSKAWTQLLLAVYPNII